MVGQIAVRHLRRSIPARIRGWGVAVPHNCTAVTHAITRGPPVLRPAAAAWKLGACSLGALTHIVVWVSDKLSLHAVSSPAALSCCLPLDTH